MVAAVQSLRRQDMTISGQTVHYWSGGTGSPGLLLLHAAWGDAELTWSGVWGRLCQAFTVIAPDLPGFGRSSGLPRSSLAEMAQLLKQFLNALDMNNIIIVGNSFGAAVAIKLAGVIPKVAAHLVLVNGGYMPTAPALLRKLIAMPMLNQVFGLLMHHHSFSDRALNSAFADASKLPPGMLDMILQHSRVYSKIVYDTWLNMSEPLGKPPVPTLLLWGTQDHLAPMKYARLLQERIPGSKLVPI